VVERNTSVGSDQYNAPELVTMDDAQAQGMACEQTDAGKVLYDGVKADIFAAAVTLFLMIMKFSPFRRAQFKDPYFKRLQHSDKKHFWKIFSSLPCTS